MITEKPAMSWNIVPAYPLSICSKIPMRSPPTTAPAKLSNPPSTAAAKDLTRIESPMSG